MVRKVFAVLGLLILAAATGVVVWQWPYFERWQSYPADSPVTNLAWYKPLENVFGRIRSKLPVAKSSPISSEIWQKIDDYAFRHNSSALLVSLAGKLIHERYWYGHEPHSLSNSMQMSHTIVALLIGVAIAEHSLGSLDDPLSRYLPEWKSDARGGITLRQLLGQRSGLRFDRRELDPYNDWRRLHFGADVAAAVLRLPLVSKPGADFAKNPANTQLLALVLERATRERFSEYLSRRLWKALGATTAGIWLDQNKRAKVYCCIFATARDWTRIGTLLAHDGKFGGKQLVPTAFVSELRRISEPNSGYGLHLYAGKRPQIDGAALSETLLAETMVIAGDLGQRVYIVPKYDLVAVRLGESPRDWDDAVILNRLLRALEPAAPKRSATDK